MQSSEQKRLPVLEAALRTVEYQIESLSNYYSYLQVRAWKSRRRSIKKQIKLIKSILKSRKESGSIKRYWPQSKPIAVRPSSVRVL
jgi:hypothetical protein